MSTVLVIQDLEYGLGYVVILDLAGLLYPQNDGQFIENIVILKPQLQGAATKLLATGNGISSVRERWQAIADGSFFEEENLKKTFFKTKIFLQAKIENEIDGR